MGERREKRGFGVWGVHNHKYEYSRESGACDFCFNCVLVICIFVVCCVYQKLRSVKM